MKMRKKSFVMTGYVERSTCNCGCISNNAFWQDGGFGGSSHLSHLHRGIEQFLDELSDAKEGENGKPCDVKVTVTIEELGEHDHRLVNRNSFSGLGYKDNRELKEDILKPSEPTTETGLKGDEEFGDKKTRKKRADDLHRELPTVYIQDIHDRLLLAKRSGDISKLDDIMDDLKKIVVRKD
jgi:hypothetical protein